MAILKLKKVNKKLIISNVMKIIVKVFNRHFFPLHTKVVVFPEW